MTALAFGLVFLPVVLVAYAYVVYPAMLWLIARVVADRREASAPSARPIVTIVVPAYNEQLQIRGTIEALLGQDYPAHRRQILILSDASSDGTDDIVREYQDRGVELLRMAARIGKTAAENASITSIRGEIVINTDASIRLHQSTVSRLVDAMRDPRVGVASSRDVSVRVDDAPSGSAGAEKGYVDYEMRVRALETAAGGIVGASGSGYAIRFDLHRHPVPAGLSRDFSAALTAQRHGLTAVSLDDAICYVPRTPSLAREYRRKVRTITRGMHTLHVNRELLNPIRHGLFAWKLFSHKVCRWLVPVSMVLGFVGLLILSEDAWWSRWLVAGAVVSGVLATVGANWPDTWPTPRVLPRGLLGALSANLAVLHAWSRYVRGRRDPVWEPTRRTHASLSPGAPTT
jgi:cellulose synthase/poly-beta-1,6-N-acetylglucosamine synthase-like glycosyltransferase